MQNQEEEQVPTMYAKYKHAHHHTYEGAHLYMKFTYLDEASYWLYSFDDESVESRWMGSQLEWDVRETSAFTVWTECTFYSVQYYHWAAVGQQWTAVLGPR